MKKGQEKISIIEKRLKYLLLKKNKNNVWSILKLVVNTVLPYFLIENNFVEFYQLMIRKKPIIRKTFVSRRSLYKNASTVNGNF